MRAYQIQGDWGFNNISLVQLDEPTPGPNDVVIKMSAAALNARDLIVPERGYGRATGNLPLIPISDGVGTVVELGADVKRVKLGDRVCPTYFQNWISGNPSQERFASALGGPLDGVMAEYVCLPEQGVVSVPEYLSDREAATLPCAALTAWSAIVTHGRTKPGDKILVQGTGGVALFALQFAKISGAHVTVVTSSAEKEERSRLLGADHTINYSVERDWVKLSREITNDRGGFDHIIELGGAATLPLALRAVRPGGTISMIGVLSGLDLNISAGLIVARQVRLQGVTVGHRDSLEAMLRAMELHKTHPVLGDHFEFDEFRSALTSLRTTSRFGKTTVGFQS